MATVRTNWSYSYAVWYWRCRVVQIPGARFPERLNFIRRHPVFVGSQYGTCVMSLSWHLEFWGGPLDFGKYVNPLGRCIMNVPTPYVRRGVCRCMSTVTNMATMGNCKVIVQIPFMDFNYRRFITNTQRSGRRLCFHLHMLETNLTGSPYLLWQRATPAVLGWFAGRTWKNNRTWYT